MFIRHLSRHAKKKNSINESGFLKNINFGVFLGDAYPISCSGIYTFFFHLTMDLFALETFFNGMTLLCFSNHKVRAQLLILLGMLSVSMSQVGFQ